MLLSTLIKAYPSSSVSASWRMADFTKGYHLFIHHRLPPVESEKEGKNQRNLSTTFLTYAFVNDHTEAYSRTLSDNQPLIIQTSSVKTVASHVADNSSILQDKVRDSSLPLVGRKKRETLHMQVSPFFLLPRNSSGVTRLS